MVIMKLKDVIKILESKQDSEVSEWLKAKTKGYSVYKFCKINGYRTSEYHIRKRSAELETFRIKVLSGRFV